jgi:hypothetical protein
VIISTVISGYATRGVLRLDHYHGSSEPFVNIMFAPSIKYALGIIAKVFKNMRSQYPEKKSTVKAADRIGN